MMMPAGRRGGGWGHAGRVAVPRPVTERIVPGPVTRTYSPGPAAGATLALSAAGDSARASDAVLTGPAWPS